MRNKRISKILGWGLTTGLVFVSLAAVFAAPAAAGEMEWSTINTPSWEDNVIMPGNDIMDYDIGGDGDIIYAIVRMGCNRDADFDDVGSDPLNDYGLFKSDDGGVTWSDITQAVYEASGLPNPTDEDFDNLLFVSVAPDDEDWLAVVGSSENHDNIWVVASQDGGANFSFAGEPNDDSEELEYVFDIDVSIEVDDIHNIAVAGRDSDDEGALFRIKAGTWLTGSWEDTSEDYMGWDDTLEAVIDCEFSPNFDIDDTLVCIGSDGWRPAGGHAILQSGTWDGSGGVWNDEAGFPGSLEITAEGDTLQSNCYNRNMGIALPSDYDGSDPGARAVFAYVNAQNMVTELVGGFLFRIDNNSLNPVIGPSGDPLLASIDVNGDADTGKVMIGEYYEWDNDNDMPVPVLPEGEFPEDWINCCDGVSVWHTQELDFCCPQWEPACKDPSGPYLALVMYTPDGEKAYATTSGTISMDQQDGPGGSAGENDRWDLFDDLDNYTITNYGYWDYGRGTPGDESAFSVSLDDGVSFNQIGLIDTDIDRLKDVAICPDCSVMYLSTYNSDEFGCGYGQCPDGEDYTVCCEGDWYCGCDSVWRSYDNGDTWERILHGEWSNSSSNNLMLRLACDDIDDCCNIYLGIEVDDDDDPEGPDYLFYSRDCGQCWNKTQALKVDYLEDFAVESENIIYVLGESGDVSKSTQYGRRWSDPIDTEVDDGGMITVCCEQGLVLVAGEYPSDNDGKVAYSEDGGETWSMTDGVPGTNVDDITVACDPSCVGTIYAATGGSDQAGGIYRWVIGESTSWADLNPMGYDYEGIAVAREGTLYAVSDDIYVDTSKDLCDEDRFVEESECSGNNDVFRFGGVARNLTPCETACCGTEDWDYLTCGLTHAPYPECNRCDVIRQDFDEDPNPLKLCGCLSIDSNTVLYVIDDSQYVIDPDHMWFPEGSLWSYEDCAAKQGITLMSPADGDVIDCDPCASCEGAPFTLKWERMCNACSYDIQIMDEEGNVIVEWIDEEITGNPPSLYVDELGIQCGNTYTWHVRMANTDCECVHSPWSETWSFTIAVGAYDAIKLLSPANGDSGISTMGVGFSWTSVPDADSYQFVLAPNADLTGAMVSETTSDTAYSYMGSLDNETVFYWQVKAFKGDVLLTTSSTGVFTTALAPEEPHDPVVVQVPPDQIIEIPPAEQITPTWIYAVIGIGAALIVVVIVLIVRTRRP